MCVQGNCFFLCMWVSTAFLCVDVLQGMDGNCFLFCVWIQKLVRGLKHVTRIQCCWTFIFIKYIMWKPSLWPHCSPCTSYCMTFTRANMATLPAIYEDYVSQCWVWSLGRNLDDWMSKKRNKFDNNFAHASHFFVHFFAITAWLWHESAQFYVLWREKHKTMTFFFPWTLLESLGFSSRKTFFLTNEPTKKAEINILTAQDTTGPGFYTSHVNPLARLLKQPWFGFLFCLVNSTMSGSKDKLSVFTLDNSKSY